ncbi:MAG: DNA-processing protein DprA [Alphaproteobacteria bacterium]|nr:DNA-processing protein DprA [Alphaproteobacteria bacterium]
MTAAIAPPRDDAERCDWLRLIRSANVGPIGFLQLLARFGSAARALERLPDLAARGGRRQPRICSRGEAKRELAAVRAFGADWLALGEPAYPAALAATADPPPLIAVKGDRGLLGRPILAIVGARNASASGRRFSRDIAHELGAAGYVIVSGLARGIDAAAHAGALAHGTVGVAAGGIDIAYPPQHAELQAEIGAHGALVGEVRLGTRPQARHFPRRNRLVSGLARGVLVVEAALKSGSLITARYAAEQGREVLAVPGSPRDPRARGCNDLIRNGAVLVESADDVLRALAFGARAAPEPAAPEPAFEPAAHEEPEAGDSVQAQDAVRELLSPTPVEVDELVRQSQLTPSVVLTILLELELAGRLARHPGNRVSLPASSP